MTSRTRSATLSVDTISLVSGRPAFSFTLHAGECLALLMLNDSGQILGTLSDILTGHRTTETVVSPCWDRISRAARSVSVAWLPSERATRCLSICPSGRISLSPSAHGSCRRIRQRTKLPSFSLFSDWNSRPMRFHQLSQRLSVCERNSRERWPPIRSSLFWRIFSLDWTVRRARTSTSA